MAEFRPVGLFRASPPLDPDELEWLLACLAWIDRNLGSTGGAQAYVPRLVLPKDAALTSASTASELFEAVKHLAGMEEWECRLEQGEAKRERIETGLDSGPYSDSSALGTFSIEGNTPVIRYDPALLRNPDALVATFAHELAHLLIHTLGMPPGGPELEEHATDCVAVYLGFGIFLANGARNFSQYSDGAMHGWSSETSGYLSENALVTALVVLERLSGVDQDAGPFLKDYLRPVHRKASRYFDKRHPDLEVDLSKIDLEAWA